MDSNLEVLKKARELVSKGHCIGVAARNFVGEPVSPLSPTATCFCVIGSICRVVGTMDPLNVQVSQILRVLMEYTECVSRASDCGQERALYLMQKGIDRLSFKTA